MNTTPDPGHRPRPGPGPGPGRRGRLAGLFRTLYGESPLHLLVLLASFALCGYATQRLLQGDWFAIAEWVVGAALIHDLVLVPLYGGTDWLLHKGLRGAGARWPRISVAVVNHLRVPAFLSLLVLLVYWPLILQDSGPVYQVTTRLTPGVFLGRWLLFTAAAFGVSALWFAVRWWRATGPHRPLHAVRRAHHLANRSAHGDER
ncbi:hypothetical protein [Streptomyces sp. x-19]|uniref:hypothetical protein n=1 Tax=Streptomyces sp. x-19 TaxID=2789280 RepID=UPI00397EFD20